MATYFMFGKYSPEAIRQISKARTGEVTKIIKQCSGELREGYALLGEKDLALIVDFPGNDQAVKASVQLSRSTGICFSCTPAVTVQEFDNLVA